MEVNGGEGAFGRQSCILVIVLLLYKTVTLLTNSHLITTSPLGSIRKEMAIYHQWTNRRNINLTKYIICIYLYFCYSKHFSCCIYVMWLCVGMCVSSSLLSPLILCLFAEIVIIYVGYILEDGLKLKGW